MCFQFFLGERREEVSVKLGPTVAGVDFGMNFGMDLVWILV